MCQQMPEITTFHLLFHQLFWEQMCFWSFSVLVDLFFVSQGFLTSQPLTLQIHRCIAPQQKNMFEAVGNSSWMQQSSMAKEKLELNVMLLYIYVYL